MCDKLSSLLEMASHMYIRQVRDKSYILVICIYVQNLDSETVSLTNHPGYYLTPQGYSKIMELEYMFQKQRESSYELTIANILTN